MEHPDAECRETGKSDGVETLITSEKAQLHSVETQVTTLHV